MLCVSLQVSLGTYLLAISLLAMAEQDTNKQIILDNENKKISIVARAEYILFDREVSLDEVIAADFNDHWQAYDGQSITGLEKQEMWLRFSASVGDNNSVPWYLVVAWPILEHAQLSVFHHQSQTWHHHPAIGVNHPLANKEVRNRLQVFPLNLDEGGARTYYLNIRSDNLLSVPIFFWQANRFIDFYQVDVIIVGAILGALLVIAFYNASLAVMIRDTTYWYYCFYVASVVAYLVCCSGVGAYYLWSSSQWMMDYALYISGIASFFAATLFVRRFLHLPKRGGWMLLASNLLLVVWTVLGFSLLMVNPAIVAVAIVIFNFVSIVVVISIGAALWQKNDYAIKIFLLSWIILTACTMMFLLAIQGPIELNIVTRYSQLVGYAIEMVLLSVALGFRINVEIREREAAQSEALILANKVSTERSERLKAQIEMLNTQRQLNEELEQHVEERTEQLNDAMQKLEYANAELTKLSITDPLTKIPNRRHFDDTLINEYKRALRSRQPLGLIVIDVDNFKNINDNYGHTIGDKCITLVAEALQRSVHRPGDMVARYGGEEFVLVLPGSDEDNTLIVAEKCRAAVERLNYVVMGTRLSLTISAGVAAWVPREEGAYKELLNMADTALYRAKHAGRNCVKTISEQRRLLQL